MLQGMEHNALPNLLEDKEVMQEKADSESTLLSRAVQGEENQVLNKVTGNDVFRICSTTNLVAFLFLAIIYGFVFLLHSYSRATFLSF